MSELNAVIKELESLEPWEVQGFFDPDYDGACPCFYGRKVIDGDALYVNGRCWRVSSNAQDLRVSGTLDQPALEHIAGIIKEKLDEQEWYNPYTIIYD